MVGKSSHTFLAAVLNKRLACATIGTFPLSTCSLLIWRFLDEERCLSTHRAGYRDYCAQVTHQLIPQIWYILAIDELLSLPQC
jgi:hypothetical protein